VLSNSAFFFFTRIFFFFFFFCSALSWPALFLYSCYIFITGARALHWGFVLGAFGVYTLCLERTSSRNRVNNVLSGFCEEWRVCECGRDVWHVGRGGGGECHASVEDARIARLLKIYPVPQTCWRKGLARWQQDRYSAVPIGRTTY